MNTEAMILTTEIVQTWLSNNQCSMVHLPEIITSVYKAIVAIDDDESISEPAAVTPAVPVKKSVTPGAIISLIDGKPYKLLKRHLKLHGYTPDTYRSTFGLPGDYPMVCADYRRDRSELAKNLGLGRKAGERPQVDIRRVTD